MDRPLEPTLTMTRLEFDQLSVASTPEKQIILYEIQKTSLRLFVQRFAKFLFRYASPIVDLLLIKLMLQLSHVKQMYSQPNTHLTLIDIVYTNHKRRFCFGNSCCYRVLNMQPFNQDLP